MPLEPAAVIRIANACGASIEVNANGSVHRIDVDGISLTLFPGNALEGGPANLYLRCRDTSIHYTPLLGPRSPTRFENSARDQTLRGGGQWHDDLQYTIALVLAEQLPVWFWYVWVENHGTRARSLDLIYVQDIALAPYAAVRTNEFYVSQYLDHTPLTQATHGVALASRQNLAVAGAHPWCIMGSLRKACSYATDALQLHGLGMRARGVPDALRGDLAGRRLQHEHSMLALQDEAVSVSPGARTSFGFAVRVLADHPAATTPADVRYLDEALALADPRPAPAALPLGRANHASLFSTAPLLRALELEPAELTALFGATRRHAEVEQGTLLSFFCDAECHVVMRAKELQVLRPHGHILHTGRHLVPDEAALTSTVWMAGVFHSMLTQGHVSINRCLTTVRGYLSLQRSQGTRIFVALAGGWQLLDVPSAFAITPRECRWFYKHADGLIEVWSRAAADHRLLLGIKGHYGERVRVLISHQIALNGDESSACAGALQVRDESSIALAPDPTSELGRRFPHGRFRIEARQGASFESIGGDELLFLDGQTRGLPQACMIATGESLELELAPELVAPVAIDTAVCLEPTTFEINAPGVQHAAVARLSTILPWFVHNALIHYLAPRGLEQYTGGGWGTRDVSQGPVELLLALGDTQSVRDLLLRVMRAQNPDGDWPQWFMFFERECETRAPDAHGDIVFWPVLALAEYLLASGDAAVLAERVAFFAAPGTDAAEPASVWQHVRRALRLIEQRRIAGTALAAYGHGDWNDSLQPADPTLREHLCSAWTVTLHHQTLTTLAQALRMLGRLEEVAQLEQQAQAVRSDFQRLLVVDGVLAGYALFAKPGAIQYLLHPRDAVSGVHYSSLAMIHAILDGLFTPAQARHHLQLIEQHLSGPDGIRLFDRPLPYHGGPQRFFQRAESASFFGREIGLMYQHAHLRYAQALAHLGEAERFFHALCQVNPISIRELVPSAALRQSNCYYSSSDAAFADRYAASAEYRRVAAGEIALEGGWRIYSSGPGIAVSLVVRHFLGLSQQDATLRIDPVMPPALDGLGARVTLWGRKVQVRYQVSPPGYGVSAVQVNRRPLTSVSEANPYRRGAVLVGKTELLTALSIAHSPTLLISIGEGTPAAH